MINKKFLLILVMFLFALYLVSAISLIENDIGYYKYQKIALPTSVEKQDITEAKYQLNGANKIFYVRILHFNNSNNLNDYLIDKSKTNKKEYGQEITYVGANGYNLFWVNKNNVIFVSSEPGNPNSFPDELVLEYLKEFPNEFIEQEIQEEIYKFEEPLDVFWKVKQHLGSWYNCPEDNSIQSIRNQIDKLHLIKDRISEQDIVRIKTGCSTQDKYHIEGIEATGEIEECFDYLYNLLENNSLSAHKRWLYKECYVRDYFKERFNPDTLADYDADYFNNIFTERDEEFVEFIDYKYLYNSLGEVTEEDTKQENLAAKEKEQRERDSADVEIATANYERKKAPTNLIEIIKEKIKNFLEWFS